MVRNFPEDVYRNHCIELAPSRYDNTSGKVNTGRLLEEALRACGTSYHDANNRNTLSTITNEVAKQYENIVAQRRKGVLSPYFPYVEVNYHVTEIQLQVAADKIIAQYKKLHGDSIECDDAVFRLCEQFDFCIDDDEELEVTLKQFMLRHFEDRKLSVSVNAAVTEKKRKKMTSKKALKEQSKEVGDTLVTGLSMAVTNEGGELMLEIARSFSEHPLWAALLSDPLGKELAKGAMAFVLYGMAENAPEVLPHAESLAKIAKLQMTWSSAQFASTGLAKVKPKLVELAELAKRLPLES